MSESAGSEVYRRGRHAVFQLLARTFVMRVVTVLGTVVLARVLSPADFGVYAVVLAFVLLLGMIGDSGIPAALVQQAHAPTEREIGTAWVTQQSLGLLVVLAIWLVAPWIAAAQPGLGPDFAWQLRVAALAIPLTILRTVPIGLMTRDMRFGALATAEAAMHLTFYGVAIAGAVAGVGSWSFIAALVAQNAVGAVIAHLWHRTSLRPAFDAATARRQLSYGLAYMGANLTLIARDAVVPVFGGLAGGVAAIGLLQFAFRLGQVVATVDEVLARITFPAYSRLRDDPERTRRLTHQTLVVGGLVIGALQLWLVAIAPGIVPVVFGETWAPTVPVLQLVCVGSLAAIPARLLRTMVFGRGNPQLGLGLALGATAVMWVSFPVLLVALGLPGGGLAFVLSSLVSLWLHVRMVRAQTRFPWLDLARLNLLMGVAGLAAWLLVDRVGGLAGVVAGSAAFALIALGLASLFARDELRTTWAFVRGRSLSGDAEGASAEHPSGAGPGAILAPDGAPPVRDPGPGTHQRAGR